MSQHPNARLTPRGKGAALRARGRRHAHRGRRRDGRREPPDRPQVARARPARGAYDRQGCRPRRLARLTPPEAEARVAEARTRLLLAPLALSAETGVPARTCARIVARRGLPRLDDIDRVTGELCARGPVTRVRYERERPGSWSTSTSRRCRAYPRAAAIGPSGAAAGRGGSPGRRACTWPSTTTAGSPTPSGCPTRGRRRPAPSWSGCSRSTRASGSPWSV